MQNTAKGSVMVVHYEKRKKGRRNSNYYYWGVMRYENCKKFASKDSLDILIFP